MYNAKEPHTKKKLQNVAAYIYSELSFVVLSTSFVQQTLELWLVFIPLPRICTIFLFFFCRFGCGQYKRLLKRCTFDLELCRQFSQSQLNNICSEHPQGKKTLHRHKIDRNFRLWILGIEDPDNLIDGPANKINNRGFVCWALSQARVMGLKLLKPVSSIIIFAIKPYFLKPSCAT